MTGHRRASTDEFLHVSFIDYTGNILANKGMLLDITIGISYNTYKRVL